LLKSQRMKKRKLSLKRENY